MRHYYLVDLENVGIRGLNGLKYPGNDSHIRVFLSGSAYMANEEIRKDILGSEAVVDTFHCGLTGKNVMDFEIAAYVGAVLEDPDTERISIISHDNGYRALVDYAERAGKKAVIFQSPTILDAYIADKEGLTEPVYLKKKGQSVTFSHIMKELKTRHAIENEIRDQIRNYDEETVEAVLVLAADGTPREQYLGLLKLLGREKGTKLYRYIKTHVRL